MKQSKQTETALLNAKIHELSETLALKDRELEIEAALERVRAKTMAMQHSDELGEAANLLFKQVHSLCEPVWSCGYNIWELDEKICTGWMSSEGIVQPPFHFPLTENPTFIRFYESRQKGETFYTEKVEGEQLAAHYQYMLSLAEFKEIATDFLNAGFTLPESQINHVVNFKNGNLILISNRPVPEAHDIFKRFAKVFEQTYTRFLDLQKAEAQTREAQIEAALESVRSASLAMQQSSQLKTVASVIFKKLMELCLTVSGAFIFLFDKKTRDIQLWIATTTLSEPGEINIPFTPEISKNVIFKDLWSVIENGEQIFNRVYSGKEKDDYFRHVGNHNTYPQEVKDFHQQAKSWITSICGEKHAALGFDSWDEQLAIMEDFQVLKKFSKVFEQAYVRFLDLQKAEAQAREARIEAALEKVRSRSLAMHKTDELKDVVTVVFEKLQELNIPMDTGALIVISTEDSKDVIHWAASPGLLLSATSFRFPYFDHIINNDFLYCKQNGIDSFSKEYSVEEKNSFWRLALAYSDYKYAPEASISWILEQKSFAMSFALGKNAAILITSYTGTLLSEKQVEILKRFSNVFEQAYTRFLDLQKAETQSRENQIQLALERARTQSMIMQHSRELDDTLRVFHEQVLLLNIPSAFSFLWLPDEDKDKHIFWAAWAENNSTVFKSKAINYPLDRNEPATAQCLIDWKSNQPIVSYRVPPEGVENYFAAWSELIAGVEQLKPEYFSDGLYYVEAFMKFGCFGVMVKNNLPEDEQKILSRFAVEFERAYTRFLDLQKAEAQARESQIQLALERVRARTMAMQKSDELRETVLVINEQLQQLNFESNACNIIILDKDSGDAQYWVSGFTKDIFPVSYQVPWFDHPYYEALLQPWKRGDQYAVYKYEGDGKKSFDKIWFTKTDFKNAPEEAKQAMMGLPSVTLSTAFFQNGGLQLLGPEALSEEKAIILQRFAKVFNQTYTRFLDLQKAEEQAREAQIEAALERVRSSSLSMQKSEELQKVITVVFKKLSELNVVLNGACICTFVEDSKDIIFWVAVNEQLYSTAIRVPHINHPVQTDFWEAKESGIAFLNKQYSAEEKNSIWTYSFNNTDFKYLPELRKQFILESKGYAVTVAFEKHCAVAVNNFEGVLLLESDIKILQRFAKVFEQSYTRFLDLNKAEAQAREAQIEAALERVRSRTLAMQKSDELAETSAVLFKQLILLGIEPNRLYICIMKGDEGESEFWITDEDGSKVSSAYTDDLNSNASFKAMFNGWRAGKQSMIIDMQGRELEDYFKHLTSLGVPFKDGLKQKRRLQHLAFFNRGFIGMAAPDDQPDEAIHLLERFAAVFNLTFTRFNDLKMAEAHAVQAEQDLIEIKAARKKAEEALNELQVTQNQLIQKEKMASLGELTAGIAHEIQNPLNFVNNFSEVSKELLDEMKAALENGDEDDAKEIANDVIQNLEKINHHGKRADAIVKGMLQHSRKSAGIKEPTDINALCDEYLRLSYHGLRAKDKSFNTDFKTDFDESIGKINIVPQDIGRVLLNLYNNAFYAVNEKKKQSTKSYPPLVSVQTKKINEKIEVVVKDNGNGIPLTIIDKIFQPFFTTKPTGEGTGLGLSLSYDIIKAQGGNIEVESTVEKGTSFIILLPLI